MRDTIQLPSSFAEKMKELLGGEYEAYLKSCGEEPRSGLRANRWKIPPDELEEKLPFGVKRVPWISNGFTYDSSAQPSRDPYYYAGLYYLQEPSAMTPASRLPVEPGDRVLDLCAAPGGKATELGAKLQGKGPSGGQRYQQLQSPGASEKPGAGRPPQHLCDQRGSGKTGQKDAGIFR